MIFRSKASSVTVVRILYLYPEEWTGRRAREAHTLSTCRALAEAGAKVTLVHAGGLSQQQAGQGVTSVAISRRFGPLKSAWFFQRRLTPWLAAQQRGTESFDLAYIIHLKAGAMLNSGAGASALPYVYEAHEIFAETPAAGTRQETELHTLERQVLAGARGRVATSSALASALNARYFPGVDAELPFDIIPHGGGEPLPQSTAKTDGPYVYAGSLGDWKGLDIAMEALLSIRSAQSPRLRVIGGDESEWTRLRDAVLSRLAATERAAAAERLEWHARTPVENLPGLLAGACAGLIPTLPETGTGRYSCPMKLYDYARCGLPVVATALPSLDSLGLDTAKSNGSAAPALWCRRVEAPTVQAWRDALAEPPPMSDATLAWAGRNTWAERGRRLLSVLRRHASAASQPISPTPVSGKR
ncbi:MAG: glycosyltransferase family 4 protein [Candidatus Methylacidiphilales bacterium]|nr:glycosyltransferase family 4 protein [Candidatus Methylacidiphilales bacterium]